MCDKLKWLDMYNLYKFETLKIVHQISHNYAPRYFNNFLNDQNFTHRNTRNRNHVIFNDNQNTNVQQAYRWWLELPVQIKEIKNRKCFSVDLFQHLLILQIENNVRTENDIDYDIIFDSVIYKHLTQ